MNSTVKCDGWMDGHIDVCMTEGKTIYALLFFMAGA